MTLPQNQTKQIYNSAKINSAFFDLFNAIMEEMNVPACLPYVFVSGERVELEKVITNIEAATAIIKGALNETKA
jgi:hypothetical protein